MKNILLFFRIEKNLVALTFVIIAIAGLLSFDDYGLSTDEPAVKAYGEQVFDYLKGGPVPEAYDWGFYGPIWPLFLVTVTTVAKVEMAQTYWEIRHFLSFALFFIGLIYFYKLGKLFLKDWRYALLGTVFLVVSPRIFAHAFYNPKDIPALVFFILCTWSLVTFLRTRTIPMLILHSLLCAILVSMRMTGLLIPALTFLYLLGTKRNTDTRTHVAAFFLLFCLFLYAVWPYLWTNPLGHFFHAALNSGVRDGGGFYFGQLTRGPMLSAALWHYVPVWMTITIPPLYTALFLVGFCTLVRRLFTGFRTRNVLMDQQPAVILLTWFTAPVLVLYISGAGVFDEWRHLFFLYPAFLLIALFGLQFLLTSITTPVLRRGLVTLTAISVIWTASWMIRFHPLQFGYFSVPASWVTGDFEMDYWGLGYRPGWKWILEHDPSAELYVYSRTKGGEQAAQTLSKKEISRLYFVPLEDATYVLDNFRDDNYKMIPPVSHLAHMVEADGLPLLGVYYGPSMVKLPANP